MSTEAARTWRLCLTMLALFALASCSAGAVLRSVRSAIDESSVHVVGRTYSCGCKDVPVHRTSYLRVQRLNSSGVCGWWCVWLAIAAAWVAAKRRE